MSRFGNISKDDIKKNIKKSVPVTTKSNKSCIWRQFMKFCDTRNYKLDETTPLPQIANILLDWAFNMRKTNGENYKEYVVKTMWNSVAKMLQEKYYTQYNIKFDPSTDIIFKEARDARNAKRKELRCIPEKRKISAIALNKAIVIRRARQWDENEPKGLQKKLFHVLSYELAWRARDAACCMAYYFREEICFDGEFTNRIEYNPMFTKSDQEEQRKFESKWLTINTEDETICPVRLLRLFMSKRTKNITSQRFFLTPNPFWENKNSKGWYKNVPLGLNMIHKWIKNAADDVGTVSLGAKKNVKAWRKNRQDVKIRLKTKSGKNRLAITQTGGEVDIVDEDPLELISPIKTEDISETVEMIMDSPTHSSSPDLPPSPTINSEETPEFVQIILPVKTEDISETVETIMDSPARGFSEDLPPLLSNNSEGDIVPVTSEETPEIPQSTESPNKKRKVAEQRVERSLGIAENMEGQMEKRNNILNDYYTKKLLLTERIAIAHEQSVIALNKKVLALERIAAAHERMAKCNCGQRNIF